MSVKFPLSMKMKYWLLGSSILFLSCAARAPASGGPPDKEGPKLISINPPNGSLAITPNQKITLLFNELLDPVSIPSSITLEENYKVIFRGRRIIITPETKWPENKILKINLSRKIRDYKKNIMLRPIQLAYNTGRDNIPNSYISGEIIGYSSEHLTEIGLYTWPLHDSSTVIQKVEADENGFFMFNFLNYGLFSLAAIEGSFSDFSRHIHKNKYAMLTEDYISLSLDNKTKHVQMFLSQPLEKLKIISSNMESQHSMNLIMNDLSEEIYFIDTSYVPGDSIKINMEKSNRLETYKLPEYIFILPEITDTTRPIYKNSNILNDTLRIIFSEPIRALDSAIVTIQDSLNIKLTFNMENSYTMFFTNLADSISEIKLLGNNIQYWGENIMADSITSILINRSKPQEEKIIESGNILGTVQYEGIQPIMIEAREIESNKIYNAKVNNHEFKLENLLPGIYELWGFESVLPKGPNIYFSGIWSPYRHAAKFALYPDSIDVRARWDVENINIEFE